MCVFGYCLLIARSSFQNETHLSECTSCKLATAHLSLSKEQNLLQLLKLVQRPARKHEYGVITQNDTKDSH